MFYFSDVALAQEEEEIEYSWGRVSSVSSGQIIVTEYDYDKEEESDVTYTLSPNVELRNIDSIESIVVGDSLDIEYIVKDGKRVAKAIGTEEPSYEEEIVLPETYEEQADYSAEEIEF